MVPFHTARFPVPLKVLFSRRSTGSLGLIPSAFTSQNNRRSQMKAKFAQTRRLVRAVVTLVIATSAFAVGQQETVLHTFTADPDGAFPLGALVSDRSGNFYGTAEVGGAFNSGIVFELIRPTTTGAAFTDIILYTFGANSNDADNPKGPLVFDPKD